jgi:hypothetical protein
MIHVESAPEPASFHADVRVPGLRAIAELAGKAPALARTSGKTFAKVADREEDVPSKRFPPYWTKALDDLMNGYGQLCAYSCFRIHRVTGAGSVDHFAAKSRNWDQVYEWLNYRLCCSRLNARKNDFGDVLDPFEVEDDWFHLELVGFQVIPAPGLAEEIRDRAQATIDRLGLNDFRGEREEDAERYWAHDYSLRILKSESPFVARELHRQGRLNVGDVW